LWTNWKSLAQRWPFLSKVLLLAHAMAVKCESFASNIKGGHTGCFTRLTLVDVLFCSSEAINPAISDFMSGLFPLPMTSTTVTWRSFDPKD